MYITHNGTMPTTIDGDDKKPQPREIPFHSFDHSLALICIIEESIRIRFFNKETGIHRFAVGRQAL